MIVQLGFYKRRPDLTHEEFCEIWGNAYGKEVFGKSPWAKRNPHVVRYVQHQLTPFPGNSDAEGMPYDGFSEVWYSSMEAFEAVENDPYMPTILEGEKLFIDMEATRWIVYDQQRTIFENHGDI